MATNDFLAYATAGGANVVDQATYAAAGYVTAGRSSGILPSNVYNKIARQGNFVAHCIAQFIANETGQDVLDDGDSSTFITNFIAAIAASSPINASTGDAKLTLKTSADSGWLLMNDGTIGDGSSGAGYANAAAQDLFMLIWTNVSNTWAPTFDSSGTPVARGVSAAADWAAHRRISLTQQLGRAIIISGAGTGLTSRALGQTLGEETHLLTTPEIPAHTHANALVDPTHVHNMDFPNNLIVNAGGFFGAVAGSALAIAVQGTHFVTGASSTGMSITNASAGGGGAHNNMQPSSAWNIMIKLALPFCMLIPVVHEALQRLTGVLC